jgi:hypothetical protein
MFLKHGRFEQQDGQFHQRVIVVDFISDYLQSSVYWYVSDKANNKAEGCQLWRRKFTDFIKCVMYLDSLRRILIYRREDLVT